MILRDGVAIALMLCWAGVVFLLAILFEIQHRRLEVKLEELKGAKGAKYSKKCFSISWEEGQSRRKIVGMRSSYLMIPMGAATVIVFILFSILPSLGYAIFIPLIGLPILLDNALEWYRYSKAVQKVPLEILQNKDQEYMEEASEVLTTRLKIYLIIGVTFSIAAPFIPQLFNSLPDLMAAYSRPAFFLFEKLGIILGTIVMLMLFIALPISLLVNYKWTIRQIMGMKHLIGWVRSKLARTES